MVVGLGESFGILVEFVLLTDSPVRRLREMAVAFFMMHAPNGLILT